VGIVYTRESMLWTSAHRSNDGDMSILINLINVADKPGFLLVIVLIDTISINPEI
jgi:hypothetical protein